MVVCKDKVVSGFNLRREANPLATVHEKGNQQGVNKFQSQARSQSTGDPNNTSTVVTLFGFQSQARSQSTGDLLIKTQVSSIHGSFNLRREANPLATPCSRPRASRVCVFQ